MSCTLANKKVAGLPSGITKLDELFEAWPVGPRGNRARWGMVTTRLSMLTAVLPITLKSVAVSLPWFEIQKGLVEDGLLIRDTPQGLLRSGSVTAGERTL
jgi:hypothetical protein